MKIKLTETKAIIRQCTATDDDFWKLYHIFRLTICPKMAYKMFEAYYTSKHLDYISVSFFYTAENVVAGFCAAAFYTTVINGKPATIARSATGFSEQYQGKSLNKWKLYKKYMVYKWQHPARKLILTIYASNPFIYSMVCKYTGIVYPRVNRLIPEEIVLLKDEILRNNNLQRRESAPFVVRINFEVNKTEQQKKQIAESRNVDVQFFVEKTELKDCITLFVLIPVSFANIAWCIARILKYRLINKACYFKKNLATILKKCKIFYRLSDQIYSTHKSIYGGRKRVRTLSQKH